MEYLHLRAAYRKAARSNGGAEVKPPARVAFQFHADLFCKVYRGPSLGHYRYE
jgi:hypothetical protein